VGLDQKEHEQIYPKPGWVEHDPMEIWTRTNEVVEGGLKKAGISKGDLAAVGITNQRETTVVWDRKTGKPVYNALVWQDTRTQGVVDELSADGGQDRFRAKCGLPLATYFSGTKGKWLLENVEGTRARADAGDLMFGNIDTWVIWNLTGGIDGGVHVTDPNASRTMLMNLETLDWDEELLTAFGIPRSMLPEIKPSSAVYGTAKGVLDGIPVSGDLGDQQAATFGQAAYDVGDAKNTYGTGNFMLLNTGTDAVQSKSGLLTTLGWKLGDAPAVYCLEGAIAITGALVQWLRDNIGPIKTTGDRGAGQDGREQRRRVLRAGVLGPVRAVLARRRPRRARGPDPVREQGSHRPRRARGDRVADARGARRHGGGLRRQAEGAEGRRRHGLQRHADAVPGRLPPGPRDPSEGGGDHALWARPTRPAWRSGSGAPTTTCVRTGAWTRRGRPSWTLPRSSASTPCGRRPSRARSTGSTRKRLIERPACGRAARETERALLGMRG
jgi:glycerol kinase